MRFYAIFTRWLPLSLLPYFLCYTVFYYQFTPLLPLLVIWAVTLLAIDLFAYYPYTFLCILILFLYIYIITLYTPPLFTTFIAFSDNQLPPGLFSISPLANGHKSILPYTPLRTYPLFSYISVLLPLASSPGFGHSMTVYYSFTPLFILFFTLYLPLLYFWATPLIRHYSLASPLSTR